MADGRLVRPERAEGGTTPRPSPGHLPDRIRMSRILRTLGLPVSIGNGRAGLLDLKVNRIALVGHGPVAGGQGLRCLDVPGTAWMGNGARGAEQVGQADWHRYCLDPPMHALWIPFCPSLPGVR
ncbi:MAG: hypothetical protein IT466_10415 [Moraxellaceae bacterium]|nr:hypothetical protein [Moraxellaceae bacterium]